MNSALEISNYILQYELENHRYVSNLRLQKLLYFIQVEALVKLNRPCFKDEIESWSFGPVIPNIYRKYKIFGSCAIPWELDERVKDILNVDVKTVIIDMLNRCSKFSTSELTKITQHQDPWRISYYGFNKIISNDLLKNYYLPKEGKNVSS